MRHRFAFAALAACLAGATALAWGTPARAEGERLPKIGEYIYVEEMPEALTRVAPVYPLAAMRAGVSGTVVLQVLVGKDGRVRDVRVAHSIPPLDTAAVAAVLQWTFKPAMNMGRPLAVWVQVPVRFSIDGKSDGPGAPPPRDEIHVLPPPPGPRDRVAPAPVPMPTTELQHPVWPPETGKVPAQKYEHPIWPPEWSKGDDRVVPARGTRVDSLPRVVQRVEPDFDTRQLTGGRNTDVDAVVVVRALVRSDGSVGDAGIAQSIPMLDGAALKAVRQWRFSPALRGGRPVPARVYVPVRFVYHH